MFHALQDAWLGSMLGWIMKNKIRGIVSDKTFDGTAYS